MENPFESGHIKNYVLFYVSIVVIMVLFFIAATLFNEVEDLEQKIFSTEITEDFTRNVVEKSEVKKEPRFKLMDKAY